ncbi:hypothetical protein RchiOBHm_Chr6g0298371 [Rosa chinensis]|uniref:Uncharacterized protein n=1 Tax=Rosa chinensis TaxID=74649 RepID=A0A2P6PXY3_ROSCH|nr:hypothetical protein RchiOBHm_Chr6g0298351 [Rosa chinensis]PRQ26784.1 hypothetical protein RchiOBHm_Chr6g0298371 [Rosa chinensis]
MEGLQNLTTKWKKLSPLSSECRIYRVPKRLRDVKEKAYTPQVVSLGPLHHGGEGLQAMEEHKLRYVKDFFERIPEVRVEDCFTYLMDREEKIRACYAVAIEFNAHKLVEIILVDAIFTFELLLKSSFDSLQDKNDCIFGKPRMSRVVIYDMMLLENQIPFFILEYFHTVYFTNRPIPWLSLFELTHKFLQNGVYIRSLGDTMKKLNHGPQEDRIHHFVDFVLKCHRPQPSELPQIKKLKTSTIPRATALHQAGVKFVNVSNQNLFEFENGYLKIPHFKNSRFNRKFLSESHCLRACPRHKWKASLKQDYFSTPWVGLSVIVAAILLVLTFIQTVCSIIAI